MKSKSAIFAVLSLAFMGSVFLGCRPDSKFPGYSLKSDGLYYRFYQQNKSLPLVGKTDVIKIKVACYLHDSLYYNWEESQGVIRAQITDSRFSGDLQSAFSMMREGDSASFYIKADSIAAIYYDQDPVALGLKGDDYFRYEIKMLEVKSADAFQADIDKKKMELADASKAALQSYISENGINVEPTQSGIYIIEQKAGKGRCPEKGEKVFIDYRVSLLSGQPLETTYGAEERFSFVLGEGHVVPALEEILPMMHLKEVVKAVVPYEMAYGERGNGPVQAYSNLIYEVELQKIMTVKEQEVESERLLKQQKEKSVKDFAAYCKEQGIVKHTESGLYYKIENEGNGLVPTKGTTACVKFVAKIMNGDLLGSSEQLGDCYEIPMGEGKVLRGLEEGIGLMTVGEKATFVLPYNLAYGEQDYGNIPAYSNIIFDVELIEIK